MAFALLIVGIFLLVSAVKGTQDDLFRLIKADFTGQGNFVYWFVAILLIGAVGYIPKLKPLSVAFLTLVVLVLVLTKGNPNGIGGGLFSQLTAGLKTTTQPSPTAPVSGSPQGGYFPAPPPLASLPPITGMIQ